MRAGVSATRARHKICVSPTDFADRTAPETVSLGGRLVELKRKRATQKTRGANGTAGQAASEPNLDNGARGEVAPVFSGTVCPKRVAPFPTGFSDGVTTATVEEVKPGVFLAR